MTIKHVSVETGTLRVSANVNGGEVSTEDFAQAMAGMAIALGFGVEHRVPEVGKEIEKMQDIHTALDEEI